MKDLKEYIKESLLDDFDTLSKPLSAEAIKENIKQFLEDNYKHPSKLKISKKPNKNGFYEVSCKDNIELNNWDIQSLTNRMFIFTTCGGDFICARRESLTSLEGAPEIVEGSFNCSWCGNLKSLKGAPKKVGYEFNCSGCDSLTSLEGAPEEVKDAFICTKCENLTSLKGAPKKVGGNFVCMDGKIKFSEDSVKQVSDVKGRIQV